MPVKTDPANPHNRDKARVVFAANITPRYFELDRLEAYVEGRQYTHLAQWFNDSVPLIERGPNVVEPVVEEAIKSFTDFVLGEGRFPRITAKRTEGEDDEDQAFTDQFDLSEDEVKQLDHMIRAIVKQAKLQAVSSEGLKRAMSSRTVALLCSIKDGRLCVEPLAAKKCYPTFDKTRPCELLSLEIQYPYIETFWNSAEKRWEDRCLIFRRTIDAQEDITYLPREAREDGERPTGWTPNPERTVRHGLGFCPVVWYPFNKLHSSREDADGVAVHERLTDEIDALNRALSQRNRAGLYAGDPQLVGTGLTEDETIGQGGRSGVPAGLLVDSHGRVVDNLAGAASVFRTQPMNNGGGATRKRGVGEFWAVTSPQAKLQYLTIPEGSLRPLDEDIVRLRSIVDGGLGWIRPLGGDQEKSQVNISRLSSKTLSLLYKRQTSTCDTIRPDAWAGMLYPVLSMLLRIVFVASESKLGRLYLAGADQAQKLLSRFWVELTEGGERRWFNPILKPIWGPYFPPDEADMLAQSTTLKQDYEAGFITLKTAVEQRQEYYRIENVDTYLETLKTEFEERKQEEADRELDSQVQLHKLTADNDPGA